MIKTIRKYIPSLCVYCYTFQVNGMLCLNCWNKLKFLPYNYCLLCNNFILNFECDNCNLRVLGVFKYEPIISYLILQLKYNTNLFVGEVLIELLKKIYIPMNNLKIIYVPNYFGKQIKHHYNSSLLMSELFLEKDHIILHNVLTKISQKRQKDMKNYEERIKNGNNFILSYEGFAKINNENILLLEDVSATGSTIRHIGNLIKSCQPKTLQIIAISKVIL